MQWSHDMKKLIIGAIAILLSTTLYAVYAVLTGQSSSGMNTICYYSDGSVLSVGPGQVCPVSKE